MDVQLGKALEAQYETVVEQKDALVSHDLLVVYLLNAIYNMDDNYDVSLLSLPFFFLLPPFAPLVSASFGLKPSASESTPTPHPQPGLVWCPKNFY